MFGRRGSRPLNLEEMRRLYLDESGKPWFVYDAAEEKATEGAATADAGE